MDQAELPAVQFTTRTSKRSLLLRLANEASMLSLEGHAEECECWRCQCLVLFAETLQDEGAWEWVAGWTTAVLKTEREAQLSATVVATFGRGQ